MIAALRQSRNLNQQAVAKALNVHVTAISKLEKNQRALKVSELAALIRVLNLSDVEVMQLIKHVGDVAHAAEGQP